VTAFALCLVFVLSLANPILSHFENSFSAVPEFPISNRSWKALFENSTSTRPPPELSISLITFESENLLELFRLAQGKSFWIGTNVRVEQVPEEIRKSGGVLIVGHVNGSFQAFVNGNLRKISDGLDYIPTEIPITAEDLSSPSLEVALRVNHNLGSTFPVAINMPYTTGLFTYQSERNLRDLWTVILVLLPISFSVMFALSGALFLCLWLNVRNRNEFCVFGLFLVCLSFTQLRTWGAIKHGVPRTDTYLLDFCLRLFEGTLAGFLGAAYSRSRISVYLAIAFLGACFGIVLFRSCTLQSDLILASSILAQNYVPLGFSIGALLCFSQFLVGKIDGFPKMSLAKSRTRVQRLGQFSAMIFALGFLYYVQAKGILAPNQQVYFHRPAQFILTALLGWFLLRDMRSFDILQERSYVSRLHDPTRDSSIADGYLLEVDIKGSSLLYELSAKLTHAKEIPTLWNEAAIATVHTFGGEILTTEGDSFRAFFEGNDQCLRAILACIGEVKRIGVNFLGLDSSIEFRATLVPGSIKAIYKELGGKLYQDFEHAPGSSCFKEAARILQTEKAAALEGSILVVQDGLWDKVSPKPNFLNVKKYTSLDVRDVGHQRLVYIQVTSKIEGDLKIAV